MYAEDSGGCGTAEGACLRAHSVHGLTTADTVRWIGPGGRVRIRRVGVVRAELAEDLAARLIYAFHTPRRR